MVGRFVEGQQVVALQHQLGHAQTGALAAGEHGHAFVDVLAAEQELGQQVAQLAADVAHGDAVQRGEYGLVLVEDIFLILGVVADLDVVPKAGFAADRVQLTVDHAHQRGLALAVAADQRHLLAALDLDVGMAEDDLLRVADGQVRGLVDDVAGARRGREFDRQAGVVGLVDLDAVEFLQRLDAGLDLVGLRGFVAEGVDEFFRLLDHPLLVLVGRDLLLDALRAKFKVLGIRDFVVVDMAEHHLDGAGRDRVEEAAVVADEQQGAAAGLEVVFQPLDGLDVEVVGGLVEQQHVRLAEQDLGQLDAHVPALGKGLGQAAELVVQEAETQQGPAGLDLGRLAVAHLQAVVQAGQAVDERGVIV